MLFPSLFLFWWRFWQRILLPPLPMPPRYIEDADLLAVWRMHYGGNDDATTC